MLTHIEMKAEPRQYWQFSLANSLMFLLITVLLTSTSIMTTQNIHLARI